MKTTMVRSVASGLIGVATSISIQTTGMVGKMQGVFRGDLVGCGLTLARIVPRDEPYAASRSFARAAT
jgi:hypothetical protein